MKQITKMSRLTGQLEKAYNLINTEFFNDELPSVIITVQSTARAYGHITVSKVWSSKEEQKHEINISADYLNRDLSETLSTLIHECCHLYCMIHNINDVSRGGTYHNKHFRDVAEAHGLIVERSDKYGYSHTSPSEKIIDFIIRHDELNDIEICRNDFTNPFIAVGGNSGAKTGTTPTTGRKSNSRKYQCPCCGDSVRATKTVLIGCLKCSVPMIEL